MQSPTGGAEASGATRRGRPPRRWALASIAILGAIYAVIAFVVLEPNATYSVDSVVKFVQARTLLANRFVSAGFVNRGAYIDPEGTFFPFTSPYVFQTPSGWQSIFPTANALLLAPFSPWGLAGITVPALLGALLLLWTTWRLGAAAPHAWLLPWVLGTATILWFYATSPNEHGLSAALTTAALVCALEGGRRGLLAAGLLLGLAGVFRDEALLVGPGLVVARYLAGTRAPGRLAGEALAMAGGALVPMVTMAALDVFAYHRPVSAHLLHAVAPLQRWLPDDAVSHLPALPVIPWASRPDVLVRQWLLGLGTFLQEGLAVAALAAAIVLWHRTRSAAGLVVVLGVLAAMRVADVWALVSLPKFVGGLYRLCPFLVFAFVPLPAGVPSSPARRAAVWTTGLYLAFAIAGLNTIGGKSFGPRLLFPLLPLLTVAAVESLAAWTARLRVARIEGLVGVIGIVMVGASVVMQFGVALPAWAARNALDAQAIARVAETRDTIVVIDHPSAVQLTGPFYFDRVVFLAASGPAARRMAARLDAARVTTFAVLSRFEQPPLGFSPFGLESETRDGRLVSQRWRR